MSGRRHRWLGVLLGGVLVLTDPLFAQDKPVHREKMEFDPAVGEWTEQRPPAPGTPEGDLRLARGDFAEGRFRDAGKRVKQWIKAYGEGDPLYPQVALLRAEIEISRKNYFKAHEQLLDFKARYSGTAYAPRAVELQFVIAEVFLSGKRRKWLGLRLLKADDVAIEILDGIAMDNPETLVAEQAIKTKADYYFNKSEFLLAEMEYATLVKDHPRSRYVRYAMRRSADAALAGYGGIDFDDAPLVEAEERYRDYLAAYPGGAEQEGIGLVLDQIRAQRAAKELDIGRYYERTGHNGAAAFYYRSTIANWPDTIAATRAQDRLNRIGPERAPEAPPLAPPPEPDVPILGEDRSS